jgi:hypothetical protein
MAENAQTEVAEIEDFSLGFPAYPSRVEAGAVSSG